MKQPHENSNDKKLLEILSRLNSFSESLDRQELKEEICGALGISSIHQVSGWINKLIGLGVLEHNPNSQLISKNDGFTIRRIKMPTDNTRYLIDKRVIAYRAQTLIDKLKEDTHTTQLDQYSSGNDNDHQEANKVNSKGQ